MKIRQIPQKSEKKVLKRGRDRRTVLGNKDLGSVVTVFQFNTHHFTVLGDPMLGTTCLH